MANTTGRPISPLVLSADERAYLERQVWRGRCLTDAGSFCGAQMAFPASPWQPSSAFMSIPSASGGGAF